MKLHPLMDQLQFRKNSSRDAIHEHALVLLKPGYTTQHNIEVQDFISKSNLDLIYVHEYTLNREAVLAIYSDIYRYSPSDLMFGLSWKQKKLDYMLSGPCLLFLLRGKNAQALSENFKYSMRERYKKLSVPDRKLDEKEFEELAINNIIHVVDASETEIILWLLFNELEQA